MKNFILFLSLFFSFNSFSQVFLNLDFEFPINNENSPKKWYCGGDGYTVNLDSINKTNGKYALKMKAESTTNKVFGVCTSSFPHKSAKGKSIVFKGNIKTENVSNGFAGLWWRVDGTSGVLSFDNMRDRGIKGSTDWQEVSIEMKVDEEVTNINFGGLLTGKGTAWFDNFEIWVDGEKYKDVQPRIAPPTEAELAWLKNRVIPLKSYLPTEKSTEDLAELKKLIGEAKMIGLGEVTHGSREIFQMKHRIVKYLREEADFDIFSIEAAMPEAYEINDFVLEGKGKPADLIRGMHFWTWRTEEVLDMVNWMRDFNLKNEEKIQFTGFDMQYFEGAIRELKILFGKKQPEELLELEASLTGIREAAKKQRKRISLSDRQKEKLTKNLEKLELKIKKVSAAERDWATQNIRVIEQSLHDGYWQRDKFMAENLLWIHNQNPKSKIVAWAHNAHIQKTDSKMGEYIHEILGDDYLSIGFAFHEGSYTAGGKEGLGTYQAQESCAGTYEQFFNEIDEPIFLLDLRNVSKDEPNAKWIFENLAFRQVGAVNMKNEFREAAIYDDFDMIIFIKESSNSRLLKE